MSDRIVVAMSGGVDSSVAALLLREEGYEIIGISMKLYEGSRCCTREDVRDAREAASLGGFPHYTVNFKEIFKREVVDYFFEGYFKGETPNPCVICNQEVKFKALLGRAKELGADLLATGHYAKVEYDSARERWLLKKGRDPMKDQTYFLATLPQDLLKHLRFPLGGLTKEEVREIARRKGLRFAGKEDSQELCFIPDQGYSAFLRDRASVGAIHESPFREGDIVDQNGEVLGKHSGIANYTIGQRRGLGIASGRPLYVTRIDPFTKRVIVGEDRDLLQKELIARGINWIPFDDLNHPIQVTAKIRSRHEGAQAVVEPLGDHQVRVVFEEPQRAITPGQLVAFYEGDVVLGGGWITKMTNGS